MFFQSDKNLSITIPQLQSISLSISFITSVSPDSFAHSTNTDIALLNFLNPIFDGKTSPSESTSLKYSVKILMKELVYFSIFEYSDFVSVQQFISNLVVTGESKYQIVNINFDDVDDDFAKVITKVFSRLIFEYARGLEDRASLPFHIVVEEASSFDCGPIQSYIDNPFSELFTYLFLIDIKSILFFNSWSNPSRV